MNIDKAEEASNIFVKLIDAVIAHPFVAMLVVAAICLVLCFLPNGVITALIGHKAEMRKLDERVSISRKKLTSKRQNRRKP